MIFISIVEYMELMLVVLGVSFILELALYLAFIWQKYFLQVVICILSLSCTVFASTGLLMSYFSVGSLAIVLVSIYRIVNLLRVVEGRMNPRYMHNVSLRTTVSLATIQAAMVIVWVIISTRDISQNVWLGTLVALQVGAALVLLISTLRRLKHTRLTPSELAVTTNSLPSVTIAIPARNETEELYQCLKSLLKNNYPKLEILVLDDCSQLKRTPEIIREFAHAGVRFVKGDVPRENWLAKNQAYDKLAKEASGEIVLFCGVDIRFEPDTVRQIVLAMIARNKRMLCILPMRWLPSTFQYTAVQAARYFWELAPPRRLFNRPPVLSSCWAIYRNDLTKLGGFSAVSRAIIPEAYFAKRMLAIDGYSFLRANKYLGLYSAKDIAAQRQTAVRVRYPQLHRRPETVFLISIIGVVCFILPYIFVALGVLGQIPVIFALCAGASIVFCNAAYSLVVISTGVNSWFIAPFCFLPIVLADLVLIHYSFYKYEFSEVIWKGRNICVPVMHVVPHLPKV